MHAPSDQALKRFATGQSNPQEAESIANWLACNPDAVSTIESLSKDDTLLQNLKLGPTISTSLTKDVEALIDKLRQINAFDDVGDSAPDVSPPERLNEFRILRIIGQGGMGLVCEAFDERLNRKVAIKLMRNELMANPANKKRFLREAQTAASIEHEAIVPILSAGEVDGTTYLVMPLLQGETLADRLKCGPLPFAMILQLASEISEGLVVAHKAGIIHRDLKPSNIWLSKRPGETHFRTLLLDFGVARSIQAGDRLTHTHQLIGTPAYTAPELAQGKPADVRSDIFSLGCLLYEASTGRRAFDGKNLLEILSNIISSNPQPISQQRQDLPTGFNELVQSLLTKTPEKRPQSMQEVLDEINKIKEQHKRKDETHRSLSLPQPAGRFNGWSRRKHLMTLVPTGFACGATLLGILLTIRHPDGSETTMKSDGDVTITVEPSGKVEVVMSNPNSGNVTTGATESKLQANDISHSPNHASIAWSERTSFLKLLEIGARVRIRHPNGTEHDTARPEDFIDGTSIICIYATGNRELSDELFQTHILPLKQLQVLDIPAVPRLLDHANFFRSIVKLDKLHHLSVSLPLGDAECQYLSQCKQLTALFGVSPNFTETGTKHLVKLRMLKDFRFYGGSIHANALGPLLELPDLWSFSLIDCDLKGPCLAGENTLPTIGSIDLSHCRFTDDPLPFMKRFPNLHQLGLEGFEDSGKGLVHLSEMNQLKEVSFHSSTIRDLEGIGAFGNCPKLASVTFHMAPFIGDKQVQAFVKARPARLRHLDLSRTRVTDASVEALLLLPSLHHLELWGVDVSDTGYTKLSSSETLKNLVIGSHRLTKETVRALAAREIPWESIWIGDCQLADDAIEDLAKFKDLRTLKLSASQISPEGFERLRTLLPNTEITH